VPTIIDRLLGRDTSLKAVVTGNGGTGAGVLAYSNGTPLWSASRNPRRLMRQAQELYHTDLVIRAVERRVSGAAAGLPWTLTDENGDEVDDTATPETKAIRDWMEKPQGALEGRVQMTRRQLYFLTSRHVGLCGNAFWYLDQRTYGSGAPLTTLYINPARMTPASDRDGVLRGWKMDADDSGEGGVPLELEEVRHFVMEPPDTGYYGIGLVESAGMASQMTSTIERHSAAVIGGGARLAGLISPKVGVTINDDQWAAATRDWRNIQGDPDSAKRLHILRGPVDYIRTAATMQELSIVDLAHMSREDKLALWGVPASQVPFPASAGLNSGETKGYDEAVLMQGAVHDRVTILREVIQFQILDPIAAAGGPKLDLVIKEPEFDDETPLFDRAQKARDLPLTSNERRAQVGLDPLPDVDLAGEPLGLAIWLPVGLTMVGAGPDENGTLTPLPEPEPQPVPVVPSPDEAPMMPMAKATLRETVDTKFVASTKRDVQRALSEQAKAIAGRIREKGAHLAKRPTDTSVWWTAAEEKRLSSVLETHNLRIATAVTEQLGEKLGAKKAEDVWVDSVMAYIRKRTGERIVAINETTREAVSKLIAEGFAGGLGPAQVADTIQTATAFNEARSELVARTESMLAYNDAALSSFREFDITHVEAIDGDDDPECADRNGREYTVAEAEGITDHPNGTLDWAPVIKAGPDPMTEMWKAMVDVMSRPEPASPVINNYITPPSFAPNVTVLPAEVTVNLPAGKPTKRTIRRNAAGEIISIDEEPA